MPTCPKCGSPRIDRFCAQCGAAATIIVDKRYATPTAPPPIGPAAPRTPVKPRKKSNAAATVMMLALLGAGVGLMTTLSVRRQPGPASTVVTPQSTLPDNLANYIRDFELDAELKTVMGRTSLAAVVGTPSVLDDRLARVKEEVDQASNLRDRLAAALRQARLENHWPVEVEQYRFFKPAQMQAAIEAADAYRRHGAEVEQELIQASDRSHRLQSAGENLLAQMQQIRTDLHLIATGQTRSDMVSLREKHAKFVELNAELNGELQNRNEIDSSKANLLPFRLD